MRLFSQPLFAETFRSACSMDGAIYVMHVLMACAGSIDFLFGLIIGWEVF